MRISSVCALAVMTAFAARANNAIVSTIQNAKSGTTVKVTGTYTGITTKINVPSGVTVQGPATFQFSSSATDGFVISSGVSGVKLTSLTVTGADHGIFVQGNSNTINSCVTTANNNTGIELLDSAANNLVENCTSHGNVDKPNGGGNADGFGCKQDNGSGNKFTNDTSYGNSDDGYDFEKSAIPVTATGCLSYTQGSAGGDIGNGNGFKMGIGGDNTANVYTSCVSHNNTAGNSPHGFSTNGNTGKIKLTTCHSYSNKDADVLGNSVLSNCTMQN
ncbi:MAG TPA: right-handed parallel beta-helix repeat-containing protein [Opitutaceae bacterium]|nr:right-handed parallel beta-helix repeat-containing protein [Opitutaceae bacterium]